MARSGKVQVSSRFYISEIQAYFFRMLGTEFERTSYFTPLDLYCLASFARWITCGTETCWVSPRTQSHSTGCRRFELIQSLRHGCEVHTAMNMAYEHYPTGKQVQSQTDLKIILVKIVCTKKTPCKKRELTSPTSAKP